MYVCTYFVYVSVCIYIYIYIYIYRYAHYYTSTRAFIFEWIKTFAVVVTCLAQFD